MSKKGWIAAVALVVWALLMLGISHAEETGTPDTETWAARRRMLC